LYCRQPRRILNGQDFLTVFIWSGLYVRVPLMPAQMPALSKPAIDAG
jgi:hypothetical protein